MKEQAIKPSPTKVQVESRPIVPVDGKPLKKEVGAYTLTHYPSGKMYHGSTNNIYQRVSQHISALKKEYHRNNEFVVLMNENPLAYVEFFPTDTREEAYELEQKLIDKTEPELLLNASLDARNAAKGLWVRDEYRERFTAVNKGRVTSEETKELIRQAKLGTKLSVETRRKMSLARIGNQNAKGFKHTQETIDKVRKANLGRKLTEESIMKSTIHKVKHKVVIDGVEYAHSRLAAEAMKTTSNTINRRCDSPNYPNYKRIPVELGKEV